MRKELEPMVKLIADLRMQNETLRLAVGVAERRLNRVSAAATAALADLVRLAEYYGDDKYAHDLGHVVAAALKENP